MASVVAGLSDFKSVDFTPSPFVTPRSVTFHQTFNTQSDTPVALQTHHQVE